MQNQFSRGVHPEGGVLRMCCEFPGACLCMGVILIKLQSGFVEIALLCWCFPVGFLHFWEHLPWRTPLEDCFWTEVILYVIFNLFFLIKYTFEDFKISVIYIYTYINKHILCYTHVVTCLPVRDFICGKCEYFRTQWLKWKLKTEQKIKLE